MKTRRTELTHWIALVVLLVVFALTLIGCGETQTPPSGDQGKGDGDAVTTPTYTITYHTQGGTIEGTAPSTFTADSEPEPLPFPTRQGYNFLGWFDTEDPDEGMIYTSVPTHLGKDVELWAGWIEAPYTLTLYTDGGIVSGGNTRSFTISGGILTLPVPTRDGFDFAGWYMTANYAGDAVTTFDCGTAADTTIYARWTAKTYHITLVPGDGTVANGNTIPYTVAGGLLTLPTPTLAGKYFVAWYTDESFSSTPMWQFRSSTGADVTLYARYANTQAEADAVYAACLPAHDDPAATDAVTVYFDMNTAGKISTNADLSVAVPMTDGHYVHKLDFSTVFNGPRLYPATGLDTSVDFSLYNTVSFWVYSEKITNGQFGIIFVIGDVSLGYCRIDVTVNWEGWKQIVVPYEKITTKNGSLTTSDITWVWITNQGWTYSDPASGLKEGTVVYLDSITLVNQSSPYDVDPDDLKTADLDAVKDRLRELLIGSETINLDSDAKANLGLVSGTTVSTWISQMNTSSPTALWSNLGAPAGNGSSVQNYYERIYEMARVYASGIYQDDTVLYAIIDALQWMNDHAYNDQTSESGNWWYWEIGAPLALVKTLLVMEDYMPSSANSVVKSCLNALYHFTPTPGYTYANRTWTGYIAITAALLRNDADQAVECVKLMMSCFDYSDSGDGFYVDGSFIQHEHTPYITGYGSNYLADMSTIIYGLQGTKMALDQAYVDRFCDFFFDSYAPMMYEGYALASGFGRSGGGFDPLNVAKTWIGQAFKVIEFASPEYKDQLYTLLASQMAANSSFDVIGKIPAPLMALYREFLAQYEAGAIPLDTRNVAFLMTASDRVVEKTQQYAVAVAMSSSRVYRYEAINNENLTGWYMGDGVLYVTSASPPEAFGNSYFKYVNLRRLPGITTTNATRLGVNYTVDSNPRGAYWFVGGVADNANDPRYSMAFMHFGADTSADSYSGVVEDLDAKKVWFFFDDEIVALGSGITSTTDSDVFTVVDNRYAAYTLYVNGRRDSDTSEHLREGVTQIFLSDFGGYYFPEATDVTLNTNGNLVEIMIDHGVKPTDACYAYVMLPDKTSAEVNAYTQSPDVRILVNSTTVSAVTETTLNMTGVVFWEDGASYTVGEVGMTANNACAVMLTMNEDGTVTFSVSEPTQLLSTLTITLDGTWNISGNENMTAAYVNGNTVITVKTAGSLGATFTCTLSK